MGNKSVHLAAPGQSAGRVFTKTSSSQLSYFMLLEEIISKQKIANVQEKMDVRYTSQRRSLRKND